MAHRVVVREGWSDPTRLSMNWRLPSVEIVSLTALMSTLPAAFFSPSMRRALSCSVCRRPMSQVPALESAL